MNSRALVYIIFSAVLFGITPPVAKILVRDIPPVALAGFLYLGAFLGLCLFLAGERVMGVERGLYLNRRDLPWLAGAIVTGGVLAPILLMKGLTLVSGFAASLLLNLEGAATALIAFLLFREHAGRHFWAALAFISIGGVFLTWDSTSGQFNLLGSLLVVLAMFFWGMDNNLTSMISDRDPILIAMSKGLVGGLISLGIAAHLGVDFPFTEATLVALLLGAFSYGLSLVLFIMALQGLGAARTGAFFSLAPFVGAAVSVLLLGEWMGWAMLPGAVLMGAGAVLMVIERHGHMHRHDRVVHEHYHVHDDGHHTHEHEGELGYHNHEHVHEETAHAHIHCPDTHHRHSH
ncbi:EamA family transporter [Candidatus Pyrohabitans sp.]